MRGVQIDVVCLFRNITIEAGLFLLIFNQLLGFSNGWRLMLCLGFPVFPDTQNIFTISKMFFRVNSKYAIRLLASFFIKS